MHNLNVQNRCRCKLALQIVASSVAVGYLTFGGPASADVLSTALMIDPDQSYLTITVDVNGVIPAEAQSPGSDTAALQGSLFANLTRTSGVLSDVSLVETNDIEAIDQPGLFQPGDAPADYAWQVDLDPLFPGIFAVSAYRDLVAHLSGGPQAIDGSGDFAVTGMTFGVTTTFDFDAPTLTTGSGLLSGTTALTDPLVGHVELTDDLLTLTVPISISVPAHNSEIDVTLNFHFAGQVVATAVVPEPSTGLLAMCGLALFGMTTLARGCWAPVQLHEGR